MVSKLRRMRRRAQADFFGLVLSRLCCAPFREREALIFAMDLQNAEDGIEVTTNAEETGSRARIGVVGKYWLDKKGALKRSTNLRIWDGQGPDAAHFKSFGETNGYALRSIDKHEELILKEP